MITENRGLRFGTPTASRSHPVRTAVVELTVEKVDCDGGSGARVAYGVPRLRSRSTSAPIQNCLYAGSLADVLFGHTRVIGLASIDGVTIGDGARRLSGHVRGGIEVLPVRGIGEVHPGADLAGLIHAALSAQGTPLEDGDIVIAEVDGNWTMKYFRKRGVKITLVPANKKYQPMTPKAELRIAAIVKAVIRKY